MIIAGVAGFIIGYGLALVLYTCKITEMKDTIYRLKAQLYELYKILQKEEGK